MNSLELGNGLTSHGAYISFLPFCSKTKIVTVPSSLAGTNVILMSLITILLLTGFLFIRFKDS